MNSRALGMFFRDFYNGRSLLIRGRLLDFYDEANMSPTPVPVDAKVEARTVIPRGVEQRPMEGRAKATPATVVQPVRKPAGYGMPCAKCRTYYPADLQACPVCQSNERISPVAFTPPSAAEAVEPSGGETPDLAVLEQERERFLREFKAQMIATQLQAQSVSSANCKHAENHQGGPEAAVICQSCYDHLQERVDVLEAALHMDLKEAAQIVYDAVWADPSDSSKSYENAASALLTELRKRSGVTQTFGLLQPLTD